MKLRQSKLRTELDALRQQVAALQPSAVEPPEQPVASSRRGLFAAAGAAALGAVATSQPASAANLDPLKVGTKTTATQSTELYINATTNVAHNLFMVHDAWPNFTATFNNGGGGRRAAIMGWSADWVNDGVAGVASTDGGYGGWFHGEYVNATGLFVDGRRATMRFGALQGTPTDDAVNRVAGEVVYDTAGDLWLCVGAGTPGDWRKVSGPTTAGSFHPVSPSRVYDSRKPSPNPLRDGQSRTVLVANQVDLGGGAIVQANIVPVGATAIAYNLTATGTTGGGYLGVNEGGNGVLASSAINWSASGTTIANGSVVKISPSREVTVVCGGGAGVSAEFIIDVVGYYR